MIVAKYQRARGYYQPFIIGLVLGFTVAFFVLAPSTMYRPLTPVNFVERKMLNHFDGEEIELEGVEAPEEDVGSHDSHEGFHEMFNTSIAEYLHEKVRVLCWIMTQPSNHEKKAKHVKATWGKRCNILLFMSTTEDTSLPSVALPVVEDRDHLWQKTKEAMKYVYQHYYDKADWFLKADDDTYLVMENLRYLLISTNPTELIYYGCRFKPYTKQGYMSGGAGYVLSKEALKRFVKEALPNNTICRQEDTGAEDVELGKCLEGVNVKAGDDRDEEGRGRFFPLTLESLIIPGYFNKDFWYDKYLYYDREQGMNCCSDTAISFHYVTPNEMYVMEYLIYHLTPYGIAFNPRLPKDFDSKHQNTSTDVFSGSNRTISDERQKENS